MEARQGDGANVGAGRLDNQWSSLLSQAIDDVSRIAQAEVRLLGVHLAASLETTIRQALATLMVSVALLCAEACLVVALVLLRHHWFRWWIATGATGVVMLIAAVILWRCVAPSATTASAVSGNRPLNAALSTRTSEVNVC